MNLHKPTRAAAGQQYAILVGLIAVAALLGVVALGGNVKLLLGRQAVFFGPFLASFLLVQLLLRGSVLGAVLLLASGALAVIADLGCFRAVPTAFISGLTGQVYKQFALTIAISTVISAFNSLTLSPALAAVLLKDHHAPKDRFSRFLEKLLGSWLFTPFNRFFDRASHGYVGGVRRVIRSSVFTGCGPRNNCMKASRSCAGASA